MPSDKSVSCSVSASPALKKNKGLKCPDAEKPKGGKFPDLLMVFRQSQNDKPELYQAM